LLFTTAVLFNYHCTINSYIKQLGTWRQLSVLCAGLDPVDGK